MLREISLVESFNNPFLTQEFKCALNIDDVSTIKSLYNAIEENNIQPCLDILKLIELYNLCEVIQLK